MAMTTHLAAPCMVLYVDVIALRQIARIEGGSAGLNIAME